MLTKEVLDCYKALVASLNASYLRRKKQQSGNLLLYHLKKYHACETLTCLLKKEL